MIFNYKIKFKTTFKLLFEILYNFKILESLLKSCQVRQPKTWHHQTTNAHTYTCFKHARGHGNEDLCFCPPWKIWCFFYVGDPRILVLEGVIFLYKFFTKSVISGPNRPKSEHSKLCSCSACACSCSACACSCWARAQITKSSFWSVSFSFTSSSQNWWHLARNAQNQKTLDFCVLGILES